jgi:hypothetical protein
MPVITVKTGEDQPTTVVEVDGTKYIKYQEAKPLGYFEWQALEKAERHFYMGADSSGFHAWTDVVPNEGNELLNCLWEQATFGVEGHEDLVGQFKTAEVARRVAAALAVLAFGKEMLLR